MKVQVIACPCGNPKPHVKFQNPAGEQTDGIFSLARGRYILERLREAGQMNDTEVAKTDAALAAAGLPELPDAATESELGEMAFEIALTGETRENCEKRVAMNVEQKIILPKDAVRLSGMIGELAQDPLFMGVRKIATALAT